MDNLDINIFSFFAGAGFLDLGFEKSGYNIKLVNEYLPSFMNAYQYSRKQMNLGRSELPDVPYLTINFKNLSFTKLSII